MYPNITSPLHPQCLASVSQYNQSICLSHCAEKVHSHSDRNGQKQQKGLTTSLKVDVPHQCSKCRNSLSIHREHLAFSAYSDFRVDDSFWGMKAAKVWEVVNIFKNDVVHLYSELGSWLGGGGCRPWVFMMIKARYAFVPWSCRAVNVMSALPPHCGVHSSTFKEYILRLGQQSVCEDTSEDLLPIVDRSAMPLYFSHSVLSLFLNLVPNRASLRSEGSSSFSQTLRRRAWMWYRSSGPPSFKIWPTALLFFRLLMASWENPG